MGGIIQIAGLRDEGEARLIAAAGVDWLGFPFRLDHHAEDLSEEEARAIIRILPSSILPVLITYLEDLREILALSQFLGVGAIQLHGVVAPSLGEALKARAPQLRVIRSLVIRSEGLDRLEEEVISWAPFADYFLTDTFDPRTGASGATGKTHDWRISRRLVEISPKPLILAGGLNPDNVAAAIRQVKPAGVDVHTGVEDSSGRKRAVLLERFVAAAREAFLEIGD